MDLTIRGFWKRRLAATGRATGGPLRGWAHVSKGFDAFLEAPLSQAPNLGDVDPLLASVILVSAPGAVGKSTLAERIAFETGAMLVDLAVAEPVAGNSVIGGLAKTGLLVPFLSGQASLIIDGLDEAQMLAPQQHFKAFLNDVKGLADPGRKPLVLLGRTGAVQESWMILDDLGIPAAVLEIGYYDDHQASDFAKIRAQHIRNEDHRRQSDGEAIDLLLNRLRSQTGEEARVFAGYSPVLVAVARSVADPDEAAEQNTYKLISRLRAGDDPVTLAGITRSILKREQGKLKTGDLEDSSLLGKLYSPEEQLGRLAAMLYPGAPQPSLPAMSSKDLETYNAKVATWLPDHPFLNVNEPKPSSAVFGGLIASHALREAAIDSDALTTSILSEKINPFLAVFYVDGLASSSGPPEIPASHVGVLYASVRAGLSMNEGASLRIDGEADNGDLEEVAEVEIARRRSDGVEWEPLRFTTNGSGDFHLGSHIEHVDMAVPGANVALGPGSEVVLVSPVSIDAGSIYLDADRIVAEVSQGCLDEESGDCSTVWLGSKSMVARSHKHLPVCRSSVSLGFSGSWAAHYPWRDFQVQTDGSPDPQIADAARALFRILRICRSRQSRVMGAPRAAVDDPRRSRGVGAAVRDQLLHEQVLTVKGHLYELHTDVLARRVGLTFQLVRKRTIPALTTSFLRKALERAR